MNGQRMFINSKPKQMHKEFPVTLVWNNLPQSLPDLTTTRKTPLETGSLRSLTDKGSWESHTIFIVDQLWGIQQKKKKNFFFSLSSIGTIYRLLTPTLSNSQIDRKDLPYLKPDLRTISSFFNSIVTDQI